jgi:hypothetical protein
MFGNFQYLQSYVTDYHNRQSRFISILFHLVLFQSGGKTRDQDWNPVNNIIIKHIYRQRNKFELICNLP